MKKSAAVASLLAFGLVCGAVGAGAATGIEQIKAALNWNLKFNVDGNSWTPKDGNGKTLAPIVYNGSTYLPARALSEALGASINLKNNTIYIETGANGYPYNDANGSGSTNGNSSNSGNGSSANNGSGAGSNSGTATPSSASGKTMAAAVPVGQSVTYSDPYSYDGESTTASFTVSVTSAKPITVEQIRALGFRVDEDPQVEYKRVKLKVALNSGKVISTSESDGLYVSSFYPNIWGSKTTEGQYIIGGTDHGFDGSLQDAVDDATNFKKIKAGQTGSYTAAGDLILPVVKGKTNYLTLQLQDTTDYDNSFFYFALN